jgi:DNA modification methylase/predicted metal-dependent hydrolase
VSDGDETGGDGKGKTMKRNTIKLKTKDANERKLLESLRVNLDAAETSLWECGRIINELKDDYGYTTSELAAMFTQKRNRLDELAKTARTFPEGKRQPSLSFYGHEVARISAVRAAKGVQKHCGEAIAPPYAKALELAAKQKATSGKHDRRDLIKALLTVERQKREPQRRAQVLKLSQANRKLVDTMHHKSCMEVLPSVAKASVRVVHLDPPYANYEKTSDGKLYKSSASVALDCDNDDRASAIKVTIDAMRLAVPLLVTNGVILLWQAARRLPTPIALAIDELGLMDWPFLLWDKGHAQLGSASHGVMYSTEVCYVLTRKGEEPIGLHCEQVIRCSREYQAATNYEIVHLMQKSSTVNEDILRRFTDEEDTIVDAFGCSASMCIAAQKMKRRWIYTESNAKNFALGRRNMESLLLGADTKAA